MSFIHLHNHTHYSLLDGANDIKKLIRKAVNLNMPSLAITDHGNMFGALEFYQIAKDTGIKPIIGMEAYIAPGSRKTKKAGGKTGSKTAFHLLLLAKDNIGYKNLMKLSSIGYLEGFYYKPRIDREVLKRYCEGIICTSACMNGEVFYYLARDNNEEARKTVEDYLDIFGEDYYLEIQNHGLPEEIGYENVYQLAKDMGVPVIATNDVHYLERSHHASHDILICLQSGKSLNDPNRLRYQTEELYLKSVDEMLKAFPGKTDAIERTLEIDEKIDIQLDLGKPLLPPFPLPEECKESSLEDYLRDLALKGVEKQFSNITPEIKDRLEFELEVINRMGFPSYFLIVKDFIDYARNRDIPVGLGRGSAAGSLVAYALGITRVDPFRFDLLFERFLNPDRISMPDIDIDFCYERRDEVIDYVRKKYGEESVAQIITFGTMASRGVVRDVARVLGLEYAEADRISKLIPISQGKPMPIKEAFKKIPQLKEIAGNENKQYRELIKHSEVLEGLARHASVHAAGIVIAPGDITDYVPLYKTEDQNKQKVITTQYSMIGCEHIGLLKMDFLGLRTLTVLHDTISLLKERGIELDLDHLPLDDGSTYEIFCEGNTVGVFQFESGGMREFLRKLKPNRIEDLIAMNALYRPGPMENIDTYINRKAGKEKIKYLHTKLKPILQETYGIIVYQEQVMRIASELGGFSLAKADLLRRAMGKKKKGIMAKMQKEFIEGCIANYIDKKAAVDIYDLIFKFASYGFNKSHSAAYALLAYQTAYLKSHYTAEFMAANLNSERNDPPRIVVLIEECKRMNLEVLPPDVNYSHPKFGVTKKGEISFGLEAIRNVGRAAIKNITKVREKEGPFKNMFHFMQHLDLRAVNKKILEALIQAGAMDSLEGSRAQKFSAIETVINFAQKTQEQNQNKSQITLFDVINENSEAPGTDNFLQYPALPDIPEWSIQERLNREKELLGFYISGHPLDKFEKEIQLFSTLDWNNPSTFQEGSVIKTAAIVGNVKTHMDKKGKFMAFLTLEDRISSFEVVVFSSVYEKFGVYIGAGEQVFVIGKVSNAAENSFKILCDEIFPLNEVRNRMAGFVKITINTKEFSKEKIDSLLSTVKDFPGSVPLIFEFLTNGGGRGLTMKSQKYQVLLSDEFIDKIREIVGNNSVNINN